MGSELSHDYRLCFEVAGPLAMFARPDTGGTPTSYPAPTWSAARGLFESIAFLRDGAAWICPVEVEVCRRIGEAGGRVHFQRYTTNYGGPQRKSDLFGKGIAAGGSSMQVFATVLQNVCYRLHAVVVAETGGARVNARHYLQDLFNRRLKQGRCFRTPCLGWSEFTCSYWGPVRTDVTEVDDALVIDVPSMLFGVWGSPVTSAHCSPEYRPEFNREVKIARGIMEYAVPLEWRETFRVPEMHRAE